RQALPSASRSSDRTARPRERARRSSNRPCAKDTRRRRHVRAPLGTKWFSDRNEHGVRGGGWGGVAPPHLQILDQLHRVAVGILERGVASVPLDVCGVPELDTPFLEGPAGLVD